MSKHEVPVVRIEKILNHNNADSLEIVEVFGYQCIVKKGQFKPGDLACFIEPDYIVPLSRPEFSFLQKPGQMKETKRITTTKLRGQISYGLLVPADKSLKKNEDAMNFLGVVRWQPPASSSKKAEIEKAPRKFGFWGTINFYIFQIKKFFKDRKKRRWSPKNHPSAQLCYDLQNWKRYNEAFEDGENVYITCKIHGSNYRTIFSEGKMCVGSRRVWKNDDGNHWWEGLRQNPWLEEFCKAHPDHLVYSEIFGPQIQKLHYGLQIHQLGVRVFDVKDPEGNYWPQNKIFEELKEGQHVPLLYKGPYSKDIVLSLTNGKETISGKSLHIREGVVIKPEVDRIHPNAGRLALKSVSDDYYEWSRKNEGE